MKWVHSLRKSNGLFNKFGVRYSLKLEVIKDLLKAEVLTGTCDFNMEIQVFKASDLMSDVLTMSCSGAVLLTGLTNLHTIRTAQIADIHTIVFVRGKQPSQEMIDLAKKNKIHLLTTQLSMYETCGLLYTHRQVGKKE